jgi:hypothetical protein
MTYYKFQVTLIFGGDDCPALPDRKFVVSAQGVESAVVVATWDAVDLGYKRQWVIGFHVEKL